MLIRAWVTGLMIVGAMTAVVLIVVQANQRSNQATQIESWPPLVMIYKEEGQIGFITDGSVGIQRYELDYDDPRHWKHTILDSTKRDNIGSWRVYDGQTVTTFDATVNLTDTIDASGDKGVYAPDQWLTPLYTSVLRTKPNAVERESNEPGMTVIVLTEESPCPDDTPLTESQKQRGVKVCKPEQAKRVSTREVTYTTANFIPMKIVDQIDGLSIFTITVEQLTFK